MIDWRRGWVAAKGVFMRSTEGGYSFAVGWVKREATIEVVAIHKLQLPVLIIRALPSGTIDQYPNLS